MTALPYNTFPTCWTTQSSNRSLTFGRMLNWVEDIRGKHKCTLPDEVGAVESSNFSNNIVCLLSPISICIY